MRAVTAALAGALLIGSAQGAFARDAHVYGPLPDWARYRELGEAALRASLPDPHQWTIEWPYGYAPFVWFHKGRFPGYATCGRLRRTTAADRRPATILFGIVIDHDAVQKLDISQRESNSLVNVVCTEMVSLGTILPAPVAEPAGIIATQDLRIASLALTIRAMPEGAYVIAVDPDSQAQGAGLVPGTVVTHINGISIAGMDVAIMARLLGSNIASVALDTAAGGHPIIRKAGP